MKRNILFLESIGLQEVKSAFSTKPPVHFNHKAKSVRTVVDTNVAKPTTLLGLFGLELIKIINRSKYFMIILLIYLILHTNSTQ